MAQSYKNFWSLNIDEVIAAGRLREYFGSRAEVFFPLNAHLKDVDLVAVNMKKKKVVTLQVKGSRAYEPRLSEKKKYGPGSVCWFLLDERIIKSCKADFFIFVVYAVSEIPSVGRKIIDPHLIAIKPRELYRICRGRKILRKNYGFNIWIDLKGNRVFDFRDNRHNRIINLNRYLDHNGLDRIRI